MTRLVIIEIFGGYYYGFGVVRIIKKAKTKFPQVTDKRMDFLTAALQSYAPTHHSFVFYRFVFPYNATVPTPI